MSEINVVPLDFGISQGLSCVKAGKFLDEDRYHLAVASQEGILKIIKREHDGNHTVYNTMDLTENGAIWTMESIDVDGNGVDEILVGGMKGAIVCLSAEGSEMWNFDNLVHQCKSAISGISIWKNSPLRNEQRQLAPISVSYSLDKTIRVFDREGKMQWSQMFSAGVGCIDFGDTNGNGREELVAGGNDGTIRVFDGRSGEIIWFKEVGSNVRDIVCTHTGHIVCGGDNKKLLSIDGKSQEVIAERDFPSYVWLVKSFGEDLAVSTYSFNYVGMEDPTSGEPTLGSYSLPDLNPVWTHDKFNCQDLAISSDSRLIVGADTKGNLLVGRNTDGAKLLFANIPSLVNSLEAIPTTNSDFFIAYGGADDSKLYRIETK